MSDYRHRKGGFYELLDDNVILESTLERHVLYRAIKDGTRWVRPHSEFFDGRFERVTDD